MVLSSPFTTWEGDELHGKRPVLTGVWVQLDRLFVRSPDAPRHVIETGLDLTGRVQGRLHGRFPSVDGDWPPSSTTRFHMPTDAVTRYNWSTNCFRSTHCSAASRR